MSAHEAFIPIARPVLGGNELAYVQECIESSWVSSVGRFVGAFEEAFASWCDTRFALTSSSGTTALHLAMAALGVGPGDEVIVPTLSYVATANAVRYCGATPVFVDVDPETFNIDTDHVESRVTQRTRGIVAVHLYGHPADMDPLLELTERRGLFVVEDAAEAHGARYKGRAVGSLGRCAAFSFFGNKIMTTGEGGMVTTDDEALAARIRLLRGQGMDPDRRYWFPIVGFNYRMTNVAAAIGLAQLEQVDGLLDQRRKLALWYSTRLADCEGLMLPIERDWADHVHWMYTVVLAAVGPPRDAVAAGLAAAGIETRPVFHPIHSLPPYWEPAGSYPVAERLGAHGLSLPTHGMLTEHDVDRITERLHELLSAG